MSDILIDALEGIDDDIIEDARCNSLRRGINWKLYGSLVAGIVLCITLWAVIPLHNKEEQTKKTEEMGSMETFQPNLGNEDASEGNNGESNNSAEELGTVVWFEDYARPGDQSNVMGEKYETYYGNNISGNLYQAIGMKESVTYALWVINTTGEWMKEDEEHFRNNGIDMVVNNGNVYIFVTEKEFANLNLNERQRRTLLFTLASRNDVTSEEIMPK